MLDVKHVSAVLHMKQPVCREKWLTATTLLISAVQERVADAPGQAAHAVGGSGS